MENAEALSRTENLYGEGESTYELQLREFVSAVRTSDSQAGSPHSAGPVGTEPGSAEDAVRNMRLIDEIYVAAGLPVRSGYK